MIAVPRPSRALDRVRGRLAPPGIDPARVREVLARLGAAPTGAPRNLGGGRRSRNVAVATERGPVVVKRYRPRWDEDTVAYGHSILRRLEELDLPGPRLLAAPDGSTIVGIEGANYAAFELVPGRGYASSYLRRRDRLALLDRAGEALAEVHRGLEGFEPRGSHHMALCSLVGPRVRAAAWYAATVEELRGGPPVPGAERLDEVADDVLAEIAELEASLEARDLPRTVIHGDFGLHNVIFVGDRAIPIDVELARLDHRLTDHVLIVGRFVDAAPAAPDVDALVALLAGSARIWPLTSQEDAALGDAWRYQQLTSTVRTWWSAPTAADPPSRAAHALRTYEHAGWLEAHPEVRDRLVGTPDARSTRGAR